MLEVFSNLNDSMTFLLITGFSHSKAMIVWLCSSTGIQKKASFKSKTVKQAFVSSTEASRV